MAFQPQVISFRFSNSYSVGLIWIYSISGRVVGWGWGVQMSYNRERERERIEREMQWHWYHVVFNIVCPIMKTYLYNFDPLKPHFYIVKLGFPGVYIIFLISAQKHRLWVLVRTASTSTHNLCFEQKKEKISEFFIWKVSFFCGKIFNIFE